MQIQLDLDEQLVNQILSAYGIDQAELTANQTTAAEAVQLLLETAAEVMSGNKDESLAALKLDEEEIKNELLNIASAQHPVELDTHDRGVIEEVWTPDLGKKPLAEAPERLAELEDLIASIFGILAVDPSLRQFVTIRRTITNDPVSEVVFTQVNDPIEVKVQTLDKVIRWRLDPKEGLLIVGAPISDPEEVRPGRR